MDASELLSELTAAEAKVTAYTQVLRDLETDPKGFCTECYVHLRKRLRQLQNRHVGPLYRDREDDEEVPQRNGAKASEGLADKWKRQAAAYVVESTRNVNESADRRNAKVSSPDCFSGNDKNGDEDGPWDGGRARKGRASASGRLPVHSRLTSSINSHHHEVEDDEDDYDQFEASASGQKAAPTNKDGRRVPGNELDSEDWPQLRNSAPGQVASRQRPTLRHSNPLMAALKAVASDRAAEGFAPAKLSEAGAGQESQSPAAGQAEKFPGSSGRQKGRARAAGQEGRGEAEEEGEGGRDEGMGEGERDEISEKKRKDMLKLESEKRRMAQVVRKKNLVSYERIHGSQVNILEGLELHEKVFSEKEQQTLVDFVYQMQEKGRKGDLSGRTYTEPRKWMRGKGRVTIQFGCCYNYAVDKEGNPPGILKQGDVDPLPQLLRNTIKRLVRWHVLPVNCVPDSCIINIYDEGDCIPPHIDHHDFVRPFCTLSLLSEAAIVFGSNLKIMGPGEFKGVYEMMLPKGSVLVLNGNGADVAKHAIPAVPAKRISITFRKMDPRKVPLDFQPEADLDPRVLKPLSLPAVSVGEAPAAPQRSRGSYLQAARVVGPETSGRSNGRATGGRQDPGSEDSAKVRARLSPLAAAFVPHAQRLTPETHGARQEQAMNRFAANDSFAEPNGENGLGYDGYTDTETFPLLETQGDGNGAVGEGSPADQEGYAEHIAYGGESELPPEAHIGLQPERDSEEEREIENALDELERTVGDSWGRPLLPLSPPPKRNWGDEDSDEEWDPEQFEVPSPVNEAEEKPLGQ